MSPPTSDGASIGIPGEIEGARRYRNGVEIRASPALGVRGCPKSALRKLAKDFEILVSTAGFEPATHALKERTGGEAAAHIQRLTITRTPEKPSIGLSGVADVQSARCLDQCIMKKPPCRRSRPDVAPGSGTFRRDGNEPRDAVRTGCRCRHVVSGTVSGLSLVLPVDRRRLTARTPASVTLTHSRAKRIGYCFRMMVSRSDVQ